MSLDLPAAPRSLRHTSWWPATTDRPGAGLQPARSSATGSQLLGLGAARPDRVTTSAELGGRFGKDEQWVEARTGIHSLHRADTDAEVSGLARRAADEALAAARVAEDEIDLVLTASCSLGTGLDATGFDESAGFAAAIAPNAARMQFNAACSGFCYSLSTADAMIRTGAASRVLVVAAERMSRLVDAADLGTSILFGDGVGAAVIGARTDGGTGVGPAVWGSDGAQAGLIDCGPVPSGLMSMQGRQVFRWAVEAMPALAAQACARAGVQLADIEVFVPHQANLRIIDAIVSRLGLRADVVVADSVRMTGNTSAASIPIALHELTTSARVRSGQLALLLGFGAGLSWAGQVVELP